MNNEENDYMFDDDFEVEDTNIENNETKIEENKPTTNIDSFKPTELPDLQTFPSFDIPAVEPTKVEEPEVVNTTPELNYDFDFSKNMNDVIEPSEPTNNENTSNVTDVFGVELNNETKLEPEISETMQQPEITSPEIPTEVDYASLGAVLESEPKVEVSEFSNEQNNVMPSEFEIKEEVNEEPINNEFEIKEDNITEPINNEFEIKEETNIEPQTNEFEMTDISENNNDVMTTESIASPELPIETIEPVIETTEELSNNENLDSQQSDMAIEESKQEIEEPIMKKPSLKLGKLPKIKLNNDQKFFIGLIAFIALSIFLLPYIRNFFNK